MDQMLLEVLNENEIGSNGTSFRLPSTEPEINTGRGIAWIDPIPIGFGASHVLCEPTAERARVEISIEGS